MATELALEAFQTACARWESAITEHKRWHIPEATWRFAAIGECLFWATALEDTWAAMGCGDDLCQGLRFARNRATHDLLITSTEEPGAAFPLSFPTRFTHYEWRHVDDLPLPVSGPGSGAVGRQQRDAYAREWEGTSVDSTLAALKKHFLQQLDC